MDARTIVTPDEVRLAVHVRQSPDARATIVLAHGFSSSASHPDITALADALLARGLSVITYDARGHGSSGGSCSLGYDERLDVAAVTDAAGELGRPVVLVGISMGGIAVLRHAATPEADVRAVVTVSCPARWTVPRNPRGVLSAGLTHTRLGRVVAARRLGVRVAPPGPRGPTPVELAASVRVPLAVVHGARDPFIPSSNAHALHGAAAVPGGLTIVPGRWHAHDSVAMVVVAGTVDTLAQRAPDQVARPPR